MNTLNHFFAAKQELSGCNFDQNASVYRQFLPLSCGLM